jgi:hypothetical protein
VTHLTDREIADQAIADLGGDGLVRHEHPPLDIAPTEEPSTVDLLRGALLDTFGLDHIKPLRPIVAGVLYADSIAWLIGSPGHGKSFVGIDIAGCVATRQPWQGHQTFAAGPVLYVIAEGASGLRQRVRAWESSMDTTMVDVYFLPIAVQVAVSGDWAALCDLAKEIGACLVVIDTQARSTLGLEENSARDMGQFVAAAERLRRSCGACVLLVHHQGRNGEHMRGSTALEGAATTIMRVTKDADVITVECAKQKDAEEFEPITLRLIPYESSAILALTGPSTLDSISAILAERWLSLWWERFESDDVSISGLVKAGVVTEATFHRRKFALIRAGVVAKEGKGNRTRYRLQKDPRS